MDGRTDRRTNRFAISISRVSVLTRDKNSRTMSGPIFQTLIELCTTSTCHKGGTDVNGQTVIYEYFRP